MGRHFTTLPLATLAIALAAVALAACAGPSAATPTPLPAGAPAPTPGAYWRMDLPVGAREGERAPDALALTLEGQVTSIEQVAGGRPILVYFFASW